MNDMQEFDIDKQEFIDRYLNTIIHYRKKYLELESSKNTATAREIERIFIMQNNINIELLRFIYHPKTSMSLEDRKLIEEIK